MIYLFDREKMVMRGIDYDDFTSILQKEVTNGVIDLNLETQVVKVLKDEKKPTNLKRLFENVEFVGHFDHNKEFQMYRIIKSSVDNKKLHFKAVHIFHDEGQAGEVIHDRRWRDSQAHMVIKDVYAYIGWEVTEYDSSRVLHTNAFRQTPAQIRSEVIERYGVEIQPYLEFDGKRITRKCIRVKQRIGAETYDRFDYGTDLLKITQEEDRGDIFTAVIPRGNGEEGVANSKIEIDGITWSTANGNPVNKPKGQNWLEVPSATQQYGYVEDGKVKPRKIVMDFDTDSVSELIDLAWYWINENAVPKSLMETEIFKVCRNYNLGDSIGIVYKQADIIKKARIHEAVRDLKRPAFTKFVVGDYDYFIKNTVTRQYRKKLNKVEQSTSAGLEKMNENFNNKFDEQVQRIGDKAQDVKDFAEANTTAKVEAHKELWEQKNTEIDNSIKKIIGGDISLLDTNIIDMRNTLSEEIQKTEGLKTSVSSLINTSEENSSTLGTMKSDLGVVQQDVSTVKQTASTLRQEFVSMSGTVEGLDSWRSEKGAVYDAAADGFRFKVWLGDVGGRNLLPYSELPKYNDWWNDRGTEVKHYSTSTIGLTEYMWVNVMQAVGGRYMAVLSPLLTEPVSEGTTYKLQFKTTHRQNIREWMSYVYLMNEDGTPNQGTRIEDQETIKVGENEFNGQDILLHVFTIKANFSGRARLLIGTHALADGNARFYLRDVKIEKGKMTAYTPSTGDFLHQTDFVIEKDGFLLGTRKVGGDVFASGIVGDASGLKLLGDNIDVQGNLNVKKSVNTWAVNAVSANIGKVFADSVTSSFIKAKHVEFDTTFINELVNKTAFIDNAQIKASNIRDLTANSIRGGVLQDTGDNFNWNLNTGRFAIKKSTLVYEEPGNAMVHGVHTQAAGIHFNRTSSGLPVVVMGTSPNVGTYTNPRIDSNHVTFSGIRVFSNINEIDMTANNFRFRSEAGTGSQYDRGLYLQTYDVNASNKVVLEPFSNNKTYYKHDLGRDSNPFAAAYFTNLWDARIRKAVNGVSIESKDGRFGLQVGNGGIFLIKDGKFTSLHI